jgi:hypothetical protein
MTRSAASTNISRGRRISTRTFADSGRNANSAIVPVPPTKASLPPSTSDHFNSTNSIGETNSIGA